jgi:hypothetical protein
MPWTDEAWLATARGWVDERLAERGARVTGPVEQPHVQWWATALRVPTSDGLVWFKASRANQGFEGPLLQLLAGSHPGAVLEPLAVDTGRHWILLPDAGTRLREHASGDERLAVWERVLPQYAQLQLELAPRVDELAGLGVPDLGLAVLPGLLRGLAEDTETLCAAPEDALSDGELHGLRAGLDAFERLCDDLARFGIGPTLQHDDLHDGNVFVRDGEPLVIDWGDACLTHPFHTLVVTLRALAYHASLAPGSPELLRLRDAYLEPWGAFGTHRELVAAAETARRTGTIQRALAWYRYLQAMPREEALDDWPSVPYGVHLYLQDGPYGTWS